MDHVEFMKAHELIPPGAPINTGLVEPKEWEVSVYTPCLGPIGELQNLQEIDSVYFNSTWYGLIRKARGRGCL
jgi:hypothetical protein